MRKSSRLQQNGLRKPRMIGMEKFLRAREAASPQPSNPRGRHSNLRNLCNPPSARKMLKPTGTPCARHSSPPCQLRCGDQTRGAADSAPKSPRRPTESSSGPVSKVEKCSCRSGRKRRSAVMLRTSCRQTTVESKHNRSTRAYFLRTGAHWCANSPKEKPTSRR